MGTLKTLKELNFTELNSTQMKLVKGGDLWSDIINLLTKAKV